MIYADNAATTKMTEVAINAMLPYLNGIYGNPSSLHTVGQRAAEALAQARSKIAAILGCSAYEITFTSGGSESDNQAILTAAAIGERMGKRHIVSTVFEHHAVLKTLEFLQKRGFEITLLDVHGDGLVTARQVESVIRPDTCLVTVMYANNEIGTIQPITEIGAVCRKAGVLFHTDAVQAVGHLQIDVKAQNIDMLSASAHKFGGPKGIGFLYSKKGIKLQSVIVGGAQERGKRAGTENVASIVGMAAALDHECENMDKRSETLKRLRDGIIDGLGKIPHSVLNGDRNKRLPNNISFCFEGIEGESLLLLLDDKGICASSGSACTSGSLEPSHVLLAIGRPHDVAHGSLRLTIDSDLTDSDIDYIVKSVTETVERLRAMSPIWRDLVNGKKEFIL